MAACPHITSMASLTLSAMSDFSPADQEGFLPKEGVSPASDSEFALSSSLGSAVASCCFVEASLTVDADVLSLLERKIIALRGKGIHLFKKSSSKEVQF